MSFFLKLSKSSPPNLQGEEEEAPFSSCVEGRIGVILSRENYFLLWINCGPRLVCSNHRSSTHALWRLGKKL